MEKKGDASFSKRLKATGAGRGRRSPKSGQSDYFVGYKKHTLTGFVFGGNGLSAVPLYTLVRSASKADVEMLKPLLNFARRRIGKSFPMHFIIGDKGYISADRARFLREQWNVALIVRPKSDMIPPAGTDADGCPLCPLGNRLVWEDYDPSDGTLLYRPCKPSCLGCSPSLIAPQRFEFPASSHETFMGIVPFHTRLRRELLRRFRPRVEPGFNAAKNICGLSNFFLNGLDFTQQLCTMADVVDTLKKLAQNQTRGLARREISHQNEKTQAELWDKI